MREILITLGFFVLIMVPFLCFVAVGWPGHWDRCLDNDTVKPSLKGNTCYCEPFQLKDVVHNEPGVRQPFNTWSNLYVLATIPILVYFVWRQRRDREESRRPVTDSNRFRIFNFYPIFYIQVAAFLGLGSMWFHASIVGWGGMFDQMSMYTLIDFILCYSLLRWLNNPLWFLIGYPVGFVIFFIIALISVMVVDIPSVIVIVIAMILYGPIEIYLWWRDDNRKSVNFLGYWIYWLIGLSAFILAVVLRGRSDTGGSLCIDCAHVFQYHGLWHVLCGIMAVMLYFHWKNAPPYEVDR
jgi:hypothetical protein